MAPPSKGKRGGGGGKAKGKGGPKQKKQRQGNAGGKGIKGRSGAPLDKLSMENKVWKSVAVSQDLLLDDTTQGDWGGFLELEVLEDVSGPELQAMGAPASSSPGEKGEKEAKAKSNKEKKKEKKEKPAAAKQKSEGAKGDAKRVEKRAAVAPKKQPRVNVKKWLPYKLDARILASFQSLGFSSPTPIQQETLPTSLRGTTDIVGAAQTGSGKTLAFGLPIIERLLKEKDEAAAKAAQQSGEDSGSEDSDGAGPSANASAGVRALIVSPTRELALQIKQHIDDVALRHGIYTAGVVGGMSQQKQERVLKHCPQIVVGTPGRLWELIEGGDTVLSKMSQTLSFFVLDEADRMVEQGHFQELSHIIDRVPFSPKLQVRLCPLSHTHTHTRSLSLSLRSPFFR